MWIVKECLCSTVFHPDSLMISISYIMYKLLYILCIAGLTWWSISHPCWDKLSDFWWTRCKEISLEWSAYSWPRNHDLGWNWCCVRWFFAFLEASVFVCPFIILLVIFHGCGYGGFNSCLLIDNFSVCHELEQFDVCFLPMKISSAIYIKNQILSILAPVDTMPLWAIYDFQYWPWQYLIFQALIQFLRFEHLWSMINLSLLFYSGVPPSPRSDHTAAVHAERYVLIFGGGSHATCFNDLHVLDLQTVR